MNSLKTLFGHRLKQIRKSKHYTQERLAEFADINLRQMARIEAGESFVTAETLQKFCQALETEPNEFFQFSILQKLKNPNFLELIHKLEVIQNDENKIEFIKIALDALSNKNSLEKLKILIQGLELSI